MSMPHEDAHLSTPDQDDEHALRELAEKNLHARRGFAFQVLIFVLVNAMLFWIWAQNGFGFPWPVVVLLFWGMGLGWQAWSLYGPGESEERIRREMERLRGRP